VQLFLRARETGRPLEALTCMRVLVASAADGHWPIAEELLRCSFAAPAFARLDSADARETMDAVCSDEPVRALLHELCEARATPAPICKGHDLCAGGHPAFSAENPLNAVWSVSLRRCM
jgi:hypothetical protein